MAVKSKYKVESGIPIPKKHEHWSKFPFAYMEVGDSFLVNIKQEKQTSCNQLKGYLWMQAKKYLLENSSLEKYSFHIDRQEQTVRVFRIE